MEDLLRDFEKRETIGCDEVFSEIESVYKMN